MPHLDVFTVDIERRLAAGRGLLPPGPTEEARLARIKRLTFRRIGAEGRIETLFPSLLARGEVVHKDKDKDKDLEDKDPKDKDKDPTGIIPPNLFNTGGKLLTFASGQTTQAKASRRAKNRRRLDDLRGTDPFTFLSTVTSTTGGSNSGSGGGNTSGFLGGGGGSGGIRTRLR